MYMKINQARFLIFSAVFAASLTFTACGDDDDDDDTDDFDSGTTDTDSDGDSDTDADTDTDTATNSDTDTDTDTDTDSEADGGVVPGDWVTLPAGSFWMGSPDGDCPSDYPDPGTSCVSERGRSYNEDLHYVQLTKSFEIMSTEVTQAMFESLMGWNPSAFGPGDAGVDCGGDCPVENLSWYDTIAYANELSSDAALNPCYTLSDVVCADGTNVGSIYLDCMNKTQKGIDSATLELNGVSSVYDCTGYRLPTESEWEYAIRAGSITAFYPSDGNDGSIANTGPDPNAAQIAWYYYNSDTGDGMITHPVGGREANVWYLYDMSGNVWEWVWDWYLAAYPSGTTSSPLVDPEGPALTSYRSLRGGSWAYGAGYCRSASRTYLMLGSRNNDVGFRLSRSK